MFTHTWKYLLTFLFFQPEPKSEAEDGEKKSGQKRKRDSGSEEGSEAGSDSEKQKKKEKKKLKKEKKAKKAAEEAAATAAAASAEVKVEDTVDSAEKKEKKKKKKDKKKKESDDWKISSTWETKAMNLHRLAVISACWRCQTWANSKFNQCFLQTVYAAFLNLFKAF